MKVLVDSSIWSIALRRHRENLNPIERNLVEAWVELVRQDNAALIGAVRQETLSGIKADSMFGRVREHLRFFDDESVTLEDYEQAARFYNLCRAKGIAGTQVDMLICAVAHRLGLEIFTTDDDFTLYAEHLPIRLYTPRGEKH